MPLILNDARAMEPDAGPCISSRLGTDGEFATWIVFVDGKARRKGWTPAGREDAAREAAKDMRELAAIERGRTDTDREQLWIPDEQMGAGHA